MTVSNVKSLYSIIRFLPFVETGEFANIGVVIAAPSRNYFDFRLLKSVSRINKFFEPISKEFVHNSIKNARHELLRVKQLVGRGNFYQERFNFGDREPAEIFFKELTRHREGVVRFSDSRALLVSDPSKDLERLFDHYVNRGFVSKAYPDVVLEKRVRHWLRVAQVDNWYSERRFDDGLYQASFPFVRTVDGVPNRIIKPFFLGHDNTTAILDRGIKWSATVARLKTAGQLPDDIMFAVEGPEQPSAKIRRAYKEAIDMLQAEGVTAIPVEKQAEVIKYARQ